MMMRTCICSPCPGSIWCNLTWLLFLGETEGLPCLEEVLFQKIYRVESRKSQKSCFSVIGDGGWTNGREREWQHSPQWVIWLVFQFITGACFWGHGSPKSRGLIFTKHMQDWFIVKCPGPMKQREKAGNQRENFAIYGGSGFKFFQLGFWNLASGYQGLV